MKTALKILLLGLVTLTLYWFYQLWLSIKRQQEERDRTLAAEREEARLKQVDFFKNKLISIQTANQELSHLLYMESGYFTNYQLMNWSNLYTKLFADINGKAFRDIQLPDGDVHAIDKFVNCFPNASRLRNEYNVQFLEEELKIFDLFFDNIEGRKLDLQQRTAVITDEDNNLVIAGAGSGKTTTIVGKVNYVIERYQVDPKDILLISFTNKSAATLAERINIEGVEAKTFHKFGKDVVVQTEGRQPSIFDETQFKQLLTKFFTDLVRNETYLRKVTDYFTHFLKPPKTQFEFPDQGEYIQYLKDKNFRTYKIIEGKKRGGITYNMEVVKSIEECKIANFLLFNGINYEYESPYEFDTATETYRQYKPDFTITQGGTKVYLEHFGISRNGEVPKWFKSDGERPASEKYREDMDWKRQMHKSHGTTLLETFSYEMIEGKLFDNLTQQLLSAGIQLKPKSPSEIWNIINDAANEEVKTFVSLFGTFISLLKSNNYSIDGMIAKNRSTASDFFKKRNQLFIEIVKPIFERYEGYLSERNEIDFNDMINKASGYILDSKFKQQFKYVIIDEFQDISVGRYQLVKAIKQVNPSCKLFCVGDDWQSIYRFSGSDISLFKDFEKYFGCTVKSKIETTYRFHNPLLTLSSNFIQKNPNQAMKDLKPVGEAKQTNYEIRYSASGSQDDTLSLASIFETLASSYEDIEQKEIIILGRYAFDIGRLKNEDGMLDIDGKSGSISYSITTALGTRKQVKANFMTVHKAKGLEADIVIVLNCNAGRYGFPSEMSDDHVLNLLLSEADQFENGEERRLFYVALTRAREVVYLIADDAFKSKFIAELELNQITSNSSVKCPRCLTADVVLRKSGTAKNGNTFRFYGCSNYAYGCEHTKTQWINQY